MTSSLALRFLGPPQLFLDSKTVSVKRHKSIALLAYLAVNDGTAAHERHSRLVLSNLFWLDYDQAKAFSNLRRVIWDIQQGLGEGWLVTDRESIGINENASIDVDVLHFQTLFSQSEHEDQASTRIPLCAKAAALYRNDFLTGFALKDSPLFNEWAFDESEDLKHKLASALRWLVEDYCLLTQPDTAIPYARRLITLDPLNESAHRQVMEVYLQAGQHGAALKQYQACEQILRRELGLDPQPETRALYQKIRRRDPALNLDKQKQGLATSPHNLPLQLSRFIGREREQKEIIQLISANRLVTLTGTGGIGKTRLAIRVGEELLKDYPDGVWFVPLESLSDPALIPQVIATSFNIRESHDYPTIEILLNVLRSKALLLILDNCEHLLDACAQLAKRLLANCPDLKILVTGREALGISGEATYSLKALSIPEYPGPSRGNLDEYEAIKLFRERAVLALSSFEITDENAATIANICRRVDGLPLAIELAAAQVDVLQVNEILEQLNDSFSLLTTNGHSAIQRHQTLSASMDWSWELLTMPEQIFMQQASVFEGGWYLESAQAICNGDALNLTSTLVKKSLIVVNQETDGPTHYRFHENIRQYARQKLIESGKEESTLTRHLNYYLQLSEQAEYKLKGTSQMKWLIRLKEDIGNIRAALDWAVRTDVKTGLYLSGRLWLFWENFNMEEGAYWLEEFVDQPESNDYPNAKAKALCTLGWSFHWLAKFVEARSAAQKSLTLYSTSEDKSGEVDALTLLGTLSDRAMTAEMKFLSQALSLSKQLNDKWRQAYALGRMGILESHDHQQRFAYWREAIALFRGAGDFRLTAEYSTILGFYEILDGYFESAQNRLDEAASLKNQKFNKINAGNFYLTAYGQLALIRGDYEQARILFQQVISNAEELGNKMDALWGTTRMGYLAFYAGNPSEARRIFARTTQQFFKDQSIIGVIFALEGMARVLATSNKPRQSARLIGWADATRETIYDTRPLLEQADVDRDIKVITEQIDEAAFSQAYEEGKKMMLEEAVGLALED